VKCANSPGEISEAVLVDRPISRVLSSDPLRFTGKPFIPRTDPIGDHPSRPCITARLLQPTRNSRGTSYSPAPKGFHPCLALLPIGVAWPRTLLPSPVVSYTTFSPLLSALSGRFLWPYLRVTPSGNYPVSSSVERGLSSDGNMPPAITRSAHFAY
jgi:hypothetical protein